MLMIMGIMKMLILKTMMMIVDDNVNDGDDGDDEHNDGQGRPRITL